jgi:hypothetical protein
LIYSKNFLFCLIDRTADLLHKDDKDKFHTEVSKLLYLAKRVRPDILTAATFLTTRVNNPTTSDWKKFTRVLQYVNGTRELGARITSGDNIEIKACLDASFAPMQTQNRAQTQ